eukprot:CAMPEP_0172692598 /NCGR_PEP_ID=MMETSP1074-20121228/25374_1 /TAXON_ID=2916 /ORGANISM="Ceratium fusus, Strain PA161109" /LENGTH=191 /DNA_ID=CAMNT_0013512841 /DNA_START=87 /DNA_END=662 /DNA_ORIENTATION=+
MPSLPDVGPPSEYVMQKRGLMLAILILQTTTCILRMVVVLDIIGAFIMAIGIAFGWYSYKDGCNVTFLCYWGMMSLFNGAFDLVRFIDHAVKSEIPIFSSKEPILYNMVSAILLLSPLSALAGALLAWKMYGSYMETASGSLGGGGTYGSTHASSYGRSRSRLYSGSAATNADDSGGFQAFSGRGQQLGDA